MTPQETRREVERVEREPRTEARMTAESPRWPSPKVPTLVELRALSEAATDGPWVGCAHVEETDKECPCRYRGDIWAVFDDLVILQLGVGPDHPDGRDEGSGWKSVPTTNLEQGYANGRFIAAAVNYIRFVLFGDS